MDGYSKFSGVVKTKEWKTTPFSIKRDVCQGDALSPLIFLLAFNPLIEVCNSLSYCGLSLKLLIPNSSDLPPVNSAVYVYWDEPYSDEPPEWYHALVKEYHPDGKVTIEYADKATEKLNLHSAKWELTRKSQPAFIQSSRHPSKFPLKKAREEAK